MPGWVGAWHQAWEQAVQRPRGAAARLYADCARVVIYEAPVLDELQNLRTNGEKAGRAVRQKVIRTAGRSVPSYPSEKGLIFSTRLHCALSRRLDIHHNLKDPRPRRRRKEPWENEGTQPQRRSGELGVREKCAWCSRVGRARVGRTVWEASRGELVRLIQGGGVGRRVEERRGREERRVESEGLRRERALHQALRRGGNGAHAGGSGAGKAVRK